jgi:hypothetical protein
VLGFAGGVTGGEETPVGAPPLLCECMMGGAWVSASASLPCLAGQKGSSSAGLFSLGPF